MINALLIEKDKEHSIELSNTIHSEIKSLRISAIANEISNIKYILSKNNIDIILINTNSFKNNNINTKNIEFNKKYKKSIILISNNNSLRDNNILEPYVYDYIIKPNSINSIIKPINELVKLKMNNEIYNIKDSKANIIKGKIKKELINLGYKPSYKGTQYLIETIYFLYKIPDYYDDNYERDVYPIIGKNLKTSAHNIKCNIRNATNKMKSTWKENKLLNYLNDSSNSNLGPKRIAQFVLTKI